ncbi:MAG: hypothetical protein Q9193_002305 [Seirophora villosa]
MSSDQPQDANTLAFVADDLPPPSSSDMAVSAATPPGVTTGPSRADHQPRLPPPPPPTLPKLSQACPESNRPDSAYGGSGGTPSLSSAESIESVETLTHNGVAPPSNPLLTSQPQQTQRPNLDQRAQFQQNLHQLHEQSSAPIEDQSYADSAYDDTSSLNESVTDTLESAYSHYRWENGRRYHIYRDGAYWGPNDETHNDQQDIAHHAWRLALNQSLYLAPIQRPSRILDVGTGTGIWAIEMAETFPDAEVVGTDLSPIQPTWVPPNCVFEVDDVTLEWTFRRDSFDFIHSREMFGSIADWEEYFRQCYRHLKPGGWVEALERGVKPVSDDGTVGPDHFWTTWGDTVLSVGETWGKGFNAWEILKKKMEDAGFVDVVQVPMKWPIGPWMEDQHMKELGMWNALRLDTGLEGYVMRLFTMAGGVRFWALGTTSIDI